MKTYILVLSSLLLPIIGFMSKDKITLLVCLSILVVASVLLSVNYKKIQS